eukprot:TRINITY_DN1288_c0_g1_i28.p1 TRINITY_DN1288_c0_g1~~TRINITY_DN1288_c0_g1_i28.p1  ORF type:complete len:296 (-),score=76.31 TRINITY_DN1288_c0_g1_i28:416-1303(-)
MEDRLGKEKALLRALYDEILKSEESKDEGMKQLVEDSKLLSAPDEIAEANIRVMFTKYLSHPPSLQKYVKDPKMKAKVIEKRKEAPLLSAHKFWSKQPVMQFDNLDKGDLPIGPIKEVTSKDFPPGPYPLPEDLEWCSIDVNTEKFVEAYELMRDFFIEDYDSGFRMNYSIDYLRWEFNIPGYYPEYSFGIRVKATKELIAFAGGIPAVASVCGSVFELAVGNYTAIKKAHRSRRLTPLVIMEILRRMHLRGAHQFFMSTNRVIYLPFSEMWFYRRALDYRKMLDVSVLENHSWN